MISQGFVPEVQEKIEIATKKLNVWSGLVITGNCIISFTKLTELRKKHNVSKLPQEISATMKEYLPPAPLFPVSQKFLFDNKQLHISYL